MTTLPKPLNKPAPPVPSPGAAPPSTPRAYDSTDATWQKIVSNVTSSTTTGLSSTNMEGLKAVDWAYAYYALSGFNCVFVDCRPGAEINTSGWKITTAFSFREAPTGVTDAAAFDTASKGTTVAGWNTSNLFSTSNNFSLLVKRVIFYDTDGTTRAPQMAARYMGWLQSAKVPTQLFPEVYFLWGGFNSYSLLTAARISADTANPYLSFNG